MKRGRRSETTRFRAALPATLAAAVVATGLVPGLAAAQSGGEDPESSVGTWIIQARAGIAGFGTFLEQRLLAGERELTAEASPAAGVAIGYHAFEKGRLQVNLTYSPATLEFEDDTPAGRGSPSLDATDVADLDTWIFSVEGLRYVAGDATTLFRPYTIFGFSGGVWSLDAENTALIETRDGDDSLFRVGAVGGVGTDVRVSDAVRLNVELTNYTIGSPFDGDDGFHVTTGETFEEKDRVSVRELTLGLVVRF